jgi:predicted PurR-regulated permease PerM
MLIAVLILNLLLALLCWWATWQVWRARQALAEVTEMLNWAERQAEQLQQLPQQLAQIAMPQRIEALRHQYQQILLSLRQGRQLLSLLGLVRLWGQNRARKWVGRP